MLTRWRSEKTHTGKAFEQDQCRRCSFGKIPDSADTAGEQEDRGRKHAEAGGTLAATEERTNTYDPDQGFKGRTHRIKEEDVGKEGGKKEVPIK
jgi:hypothetical protein